MYTSSRAKRHRLGSASPGCLLLPRRFATLSSPPPASASVNCRSQRRDSHSFCGERLLKKLFFAAPMIFSLVLPCAAQRKPVLPQIDLPHPYYFREMYLPQLTSGPSSVAWSPDSKEVIYSMAGSLWRQKIDSKSAKQLTDGSGYDYQPDWSPDGKTVVYVSYQKD